MTEAPGSLNVEYLILRIAEILGNLNLHELPTGLYVLFQNVLIIGMVVSMMFIVLIVYALIRLHQVEHEGFHVLEAEAHAHHEEEVETTGRNDRWERVISLATGSSEGDWRRAILEADIMLFDVLRNNGYPGDTVGEQLKNANPIQMTTLDLAWRAHKVRNEVAHAGEAAPLSERDARTAIDYYKRVFEEFGAI